MTPPIHEFFAISFTWELCFKQLSFVGLLAGLLYGVRWYLEDGWNAATGDDEHNTIGSTEYIQRTGDVERDHRLRMMQALEFQQDEQDKSDLENEQRKIAREKKIVIALANRNMKVVSSLCNKCGANFGAGHKCQYCGTAKETYS